MAWYKPLSGRDARGSSMAVLLMNNAPKASPPSRITSGRPGHHEWA